MPPDANCLLAVADHCLRSRDYINVIVAGKQPSFQWLDMDRAEAHCEAGIGVWDWASHGDSALPDVVMACAGDVPTLETLAAVMLLREHCPEIAVRVVNVVDLFTLQSSATHPHGLSDSDYDTIFPPTTPVIFAFHGYPSLIHQLSYSRSNHRQLHVHGYCEEGTTTTPFDMCVMNRIDRFHLALNAVSRIPSQKDLAERGASAIEEKLAEHQRHIETHGEDLPEITEWQWTA